MPRCATWCKVDQSEVLMRNKEIPARLRFPIDHILASRFPILGCGTEALVFAGTNYVIKRRVCDGRWWEFDLNRFAEKHPGMKLKEYPLFLKECVQLGDYDMLIQERVEPISAKKFATEIRAQWFSTFDPSWAEFLFWEWGWRQSTNTFHVFDWG